MVKLHFPSENKEENALLLQRQSHFAPQNKEDYMSELYNHKVVEKKWQKVWDDNKAFAATDDYSKPKYYALVEFPYPSGQGLHVGHPRPYTALDIVARKRRMQGYNVLYPMGWDFRPRTMRSKIRFIRRS